jgi:hypothetical protein
MVGPYVRGEQIPATVCAVLPNRCQYYCPARFIQHIKLLNHVAVFVSDTLLVWIHQPAAKQIVIPVDRPGCLAVQASAIAGKCQEIPQSRT